MGDACAVGGFWHLAALYIPAVIVAALLIWRAIDDRRFYQEVHEIERRLDEVSETISKLEQSNA